MPTPRTERGKKIGRPSSLTPERHDKIVELISAGNYVDTAAGAAGVHKSTFYLWLDRGQSERDRLTATPGADPDPDEAPFLDFLNAIEKAQNEAEARNVAIIQRAAVTGTWQAAAWWLERTRSKKYARMEKTEVTGTDGGAVRVDVSTEDLERKIVKILEKREG
jgi:hypothetical protein